MPGDDVDAPNGSPALDDDRKTFEALAASAQGDPFWAVRRSAVEALAKVADKQGPAILKRTALDVHASVRIASLVALGDLKDRNLVAFFKERFAKDGSDGVRAEALRAIGKAGDRSAIPFLEKCVEVPSFRNLIATAAKQAVESAGAQEQP